LYVTKYALQQMYPCGGVTAGVSDVVLDPEAFAAEPRMFDSKPLRIITVGSMANLHKGYDVLIDAVGMCVRRGLDAQLVLVGDGRHRSELGRRAEVAGLTARTRFAGEVHPASAVRAALDAADLFVLPSRTEGLPRALVEAMARALPCIGTAVGGIPELLHKDDLVAPRDARALGGRILEVASDRGRMGQMSRRNWQKAFEYQQAPLIAARTDFYQRVKERTNKRLFPELELDRLGSSKAFREDFRP
jgi:glycosyltransferase involved in cell wall biosynthesis